MKRTISAMVGKGSVNHNSRKFTAENVVPERTHLNIDYCNENIKKIYHDLFDEALKRYNDKQTRADRKIANYYEKISNSKQEKPFHEIILQIGDKENMAAESENGQLSRRVLDEYYQGFQERNPQLKVFSAHLHMDEATPHLHIDFVPFTTGSKRGLDTRVSLKQALAAQGFKGGTRGDTEWSQWVQSEKEQLAAVMERHGIEWEHKGTHEKHLSVLDYKKQEREKEEMSKQEASVKPEKPKKKQEKAERKETAAKQEQTEPVREKKTDCKKLRNGNAISEGPVKVEYAVTDTEENLPGQMTFGMEESESGLEEFSDEETKAEDPVQTEEISVDEEITAETDADGFRAVKETDEVPFDEDDEISFDAEEEEETPEETAEEVLEDMAHEEDAEDEVKWAEKVICNFGVYAGTPLGEMMQDARGYQTIKWLVQRYKGQNQEIQKAAKILLDHEKEMQKAA